jgi:hypothetical protein
MPRAKWRLCHVSRRDDAMCQEDLAYVGENLRRSGCSSKFKDWQGRVLAKKVDDDEGIDDTMRTVDMPLGERNIRC